MDRWNRLLILLTVVGLASAQINFSTSWGKRLVRPVPAAAPGRALGPARPGRALRAPAAVRATVLQFHASFTRDPRGISLFFLYFLTSLMIHDKK